LKEFDPLSVDGSLFEDLKQYAALEELDAVPVLSIWTHAVRISNSGNRQ
jgi:hypothetical protein